MATPEVLNPRLNQLPVSEPQNWHRYLVLIAACCGTFVGFGSVVIFTFGVFLKPLTAAFGWTRSQVSLAFTLTAVTVAICSPFIGKLLDRFPARRVMVPCTVTYALAFASLSLLSRHIAHLLAVFVLMGVIGNGTTQLGYARVVSSWFHESRGRALAAVMTGSAAGSMIFPLFAQWLISTYGWRTAYAVLGGLILLLGVPLTAMFLREPVGSHAAAEASQAGPRSGIVRDLLSRPFLFLTGALVLFSISTNGLQAHLPPLLTDRGLFPRQAAAVLSMAGFATLASRIVTGYLLDRFLASRVAASLFLVCAAGFIVIVYGHSFTVQILGAILVGAGLGAETDAVPYLLTRYFGLSRFSELYAWTWSAYAVAGASGPFIMGLAFDRTGSYRITLLLFSAFVLGAAALFGLLPNYRIQATSTSH
jgi:MFS family permease